MYPINNGTLAPCGHWVEVLIICGKMDLLYIIHIKTTFRYFRIWSKCGNDGNILHAIFKV